MDVIRKIERENMRMDMPAFRSGDTVKVYLRIVEGEKERIQIFQGNVIRFKRGTTNSTFTVRKISDGVGVERIFPLNSPFIDHVEVVTQGAPQPPVLPQKTQGQGRQNQAAWPLLILCDRFVPELMKPEGAAWPAPLWQRQ